MASETHFASSVKITAVALSVSSWSMLPPKPLSQIPDWKWVLLWLSLASLYLPNTKLWNYSSLSFWARLWEGWSSLWLANSLCLFFMGFLFGSIFISNSVAQYAACIFFHHISHTSLEMALGSFWQEGPRCRSANLFWKGSDDKLFWLFGPCAPSPSCSALPL